MLNNPGVYLIQNKKTMKEYVGSAVCLKRRFAQHVRELNKGKHHSPKLQRSWLKYGPDAFEFVPVLICDVKLLLYYEQRVMDALSPEYNICRIAGSMLGVKRKPFSDKHKENLSRARSTRQKETRTEEQKKRMSDAQKKRFASDPPVKRGPLSEETKAKIAAATKRQMAAMSPERKRELAYMGVAALAKKKALLAKEQNDNK